MKKVIVFILVICMVASLLNGIFIQAEESTVLWENTGGYFDCYGGKLSRSVVDGSTCGSIENKVQKFTFTNATSFYNGGPAAGGFGNAWATADLTGKIDSSVLTFSMKTPKDGMRFSLWFCDDNTYGRLYKNFEVAAKDTWTSFTVPLSDMIKPNSNTLQTLQYITINPWYNGASGTQAVNGDVFYLGEVKVKNTVLWKNAGGYFDLYGGKLSRSVVDGSTCGSIENKVQKFTFTNATSFYNGGPAAGGQPNGGILPAVLTDKIDSSVLTFSMKTPKDGMRFSLWFCDDTNGGRLYKNFEVAAKDTWTSFTVPLSDMLKGANGVTLQQLQYITINPWEGSEKGTQAVNGDAFYLGEVKVTKTTYNSLWKNAGGYFDCYGGKLSRSVVDGSTCGSIENKVQKFTFTNATSFYNGGPAAGGQPNGGILPAVLTGKIDSSVLTFSMKTPKDGMRFSLWFCDDTNGGRLYKNFEVATKDTWTSFTVPVSDMLIGANGITLQQLQYILINPWEGSEKGTQAVNDDVFYFGEVKVTETTSKTLWQNAGSDFENSSVLNYAVVDGSTCGSAQNKAHKFTFTNASAFYNDDIATCAYNDTGTSVDLTGKINSSVLTFSIKTPKDGMRFSLWFMDNTNKGRLYTNFEVTTKDTWKSFTVPLSDMIQLNTFNQIDYIGIKAWQDGDRGTQAENGDVFYLGEVEVRSKALWQNTGGYFDCYGGKLSRSVVDGSTCGSIENKVHKFTFTDATSFYNGGPAAGGLGNAWATADLTGKIDNSVLTFSMKTPKDGMRFSLWFCDDNTYGRLYKNFEVAAKDTWTSFTVPLSDMIKPNSNTLQTLQYILINPWEGSEKGVQAVNGDDFYLGEVEVRSAEFLWKNSGLSGFNNSSGFNYETVDGSTCTSTQNKAHKFTFTNATAFYNDETPLYAIGNTGNNVDLTNKIDSSVLTFSIKTPKDGMRFSLWFCDDTNGGRLYTNFEVVAKDKWTNFTVPLTDMLKGSNAYSFKQLQKIRINPWQDGDKGTQAGNGDVFYLGNVTVRENCGLTSAASITRKTVVVGTSLTTALGSTTAAVLNGQATQQIAVTWNASEYNANVPGIYTVHGTLLVSGTNSLSALGLLNINNVQAVATVEVKKFIINTYTLNGTMLKNVAPLSGGLTETKFLEKISIGTGTNYTFSNQKVTGKVGTGTTFQITDGESNPSYTVLIKGDVTGDGSVSVEDLAAMKSDLLKLSPLAGVYKTAGEVSQDGNISISDLLSIKKHILGIKTINDPTSFAPEDDVVSQPITPNTKLRLELIQYHPGVEGYDLSYDLRAFYDNVPLNSSDVELTSNLSGVQINNMNVFIPSSVKSTGDTLVITAEYNGEYSTLSIPFVKWNKTFEDNFDGNILDKSKWSALEPDLYKPTMPYSVTPTDGSCIVNNGNLIMKVEKRDYLASNGNWYGYVNSAIGTGSKYSQKYGLFTAKMKLPKASGILHSFWMVNDGPRGPEYLFTDVYNSQQVGCGETDIFEYCKPFNNQVTMSDHLWAFNGNYVAGRGKFVTVSNFNNGYNEYSLVWTEHAIYYYVDGNLARVVNDIDSSNGKPGALLLSSYLGIPENHTGSNEAAWLGYFKDSELPAYTYVDYVKAYH